MAVNPGASCGETVQRGHGGFVCKGVSSGISGSRVEVLPTYPPRVFLESCSCPGADLRELGEDVAETAWKHSPDKCGIV